MGDEYLAYHFDRTFFLNPHSLTKGHLKNMLISHHGRIGSITTVKDWGQCHPAAAYIRLKGNVCFQDTIPELIENLHIFSTLVDASH